MASISWLLYTYFAFISKLSLSIKSQYVNSDTAQIARIQSLKGKKNNCGVAVFQLLQIEPNEIME